MTLEQTAFFSKGDVVRAHVTPNLERRRGLLALALGGFSTELIASGAALRTWRRLDANTQNQLMPAKQSPPPRVLPALYALQNGAAEISISLAKPSGRFPFSMPLAQYYGNGEWKLEPNVPEVEADAGLVLGQIKELTAGGYKGIDLYRMIIPGQPLALEPAALAVAAFTEFVS